MTAPGSHPGAFGPPEWGLSLTVAATWGSTFMLVALALKDLRPGVLALVRVVVAVGIMVVLRDARRPVAREDWPRIAVLGVVWVAIPLLLVPYALLLITSSVAAMVNSAGPLATTLIAAVMLRRRPRALHCLGFLVALAGLVLLSYRPGGEGSADPAGVALVLGAVACYALGSNLAVPLQQRYGAFPLLLRAQAVAAVALVPFAVADVSASRYGVGSLLAAAGVGAVGSSAAFLALSTLLGRVGASRGAVAIYLVPCVATALGVVVLDEEVPGIALAGLALVLAGAGLVSRRDTAASELPPLTRERSGSRAGS
jgi:drug/metabolite transporter (DMT)-like permease